jgi:hypothetical protein
MELVGEHELVSSRVPVRTCRICGGHVELDELVSYFDVLGSSACGQCEARAVVSGSEVDVAPVATRVRKVTTGGFEMPPVEPRPSVDSTIAVKIVPRHLPPFCALARVDFVGDGVVRCTFVEMSTKARVILSFWLGPSGGLQPLAGTIDSDHALVGATTA